MTLEIDRGTTHRHMVLAVRHKGRWGAMGLSRRECLMDKRFEYETLTDLIRDFDESYVSHDICLCDYAFPTSPFKNLPRLFAEGVHAHAGCGLCRSSIAPRVRIEDANLLEGSENSNFVQELCLYR